MSGAWTQARIAAEAKRLGPWFHNLNLRGVRTAPEHFLGDYPMIKWRSFRDAIPADLAGKSVLDIGCNGGFYALEMKRRGAARVVAMDFDADYLAQARFAAEVEGADIEFRELGVYDVAALRERFDIVLFLGVLYHLRHPLLALDLIWEHAVADMLVVQSLQRGADETMATPDDQQFTDTAPFDDPRYPRLHFIEHAYAGDPTNWWAPNASCIAAMLRASGFELTARPEREVWIARRTQRPPFSYGAVYPMRGATP